MHANPMSKHNKAQYSKHVCAWLTHQHVCATPLIVKVLCHTRKQVYFSIDGYPTWTLAPVAMVIFFICSPFLPMMIPNMSAGISRRKVSPACGCFSRSVST